MSTQGFCFSANTSCGFWLSIEFRQSLRILQMADEELDVFLSEQSVINPFLELEYGGTEDIGGARNDIETSLAPLSCAEIQKEDVDCRNTCSDQRGHLQYTDLCSEEQGVHEKQFCQHIKTQLITECSNEEMIIVEVLLSYIELNGFLRTPLEEICVNHDLDQDKVVLVLAKIKSCDPLGVGSRDMREFFLLQAKEKGWSKDSIVSNLLTKCYEDFLYNRIKKIANKLHTSVQEVENTRAMLKTWPVSPVYAYGTVHNNYVTPDLIIYCKDDWCYAEVPRKNKLRYNHSYDSLLMENRVSMEDEALNVVKKWKLFGKSILRGVKKRQSVLLSVGQVLCQQQKRFLMGKTDVVSPLTMRNVADILQVHDSLINRAVMGKFVYTKSKGIFPMKSLFSKEVVNSNGKICSKDYIAHKIRNIIKHEDKQAPYTDMYIQKALLKEGVSCARRTITKYRTDMNIPIAHMRRSFL